jgi:MFS family permease
MCTLIAEVIMLIGGLYALIAGKLKLTKNLRLEGWRARVAGLILASPMPLAFVIGALLGVLVGTGVLPEEVVDYAGFVDIALVLLALVAVVIFGYAVRPKPAPAEPELPADLS